jgi:hypothetical protein
MMGFADFGMDGFLKETGMDRNRQPTAEPVKNETEVTLRRAYQKPALRHLGSVRELTFGATMGNFGDGGGMMTGPM